MYFVEVDEIVFKVTSAMVMMLTKLSLFLEVVSSGCLCLSVRFVRKDFYCGGNSVFMQEIIIEKDFLFLQIFWQHICSLFETHSKLYYIIYTCGLYHCDRIYCVSLNDVTLKLFFYNVANRWFLKNFFFDRYSFYFCVSVFSKRGK